MHALTEIFTEMTRICLYPNTKKGQFQTEKNYQSMFQGIIYVIQKGEL